MVASGLGPLRWLERHHGRPPTLKSVKSVTLSCGCRVAADRRVHGAGISDQRRQELEAFHAEIHAIEQRHHDEHMARMVRMAGTGTFPASKFVNSAVPATALFVGVESESSANRKRAGR